MSGYPPQGMSGAYIIAAINASAGLIDDDNIAATIARDTEVTDDISTHSALDEGIHGLLKKYVIGDVALQNNGAERYTTNGGYTKKLDIEIDTLHADPSTLRVGFQLKTTNAGSAAWGRIYKNGVAAGAERTTIDTNYETFEEDIAFAEGDLIQLYLHVTAGFQAWGTNLQVKGTNHQQTIAEAINQDDVGETEGFEGTNHTF